MLVKGLHEAGWMVRCPKASMYIWAKIPSSIGRWALAQFARLMMLPEKAKGLRVAGHRLRDHGDDHIRFTDRE